MDRATNQLGVLELSAIHEIANIGAGHAATALSSLTGTPFHLHVPRLELQPVESVGALMGGFEQICASVLMQIDGELEGQVALFLHWDAAQRLWQRLIGYAPEEAGEIDDLAASTLLEVGNVLISNFLNALADMTQLPAHATPPWLSVEMVASSITAIVCQAEMLDAMALGIQTQIESETEDFKALILFIPTGDGLKRILTRLGVQGAA